LTREIDISNIFQDIKDMVYLKDLVRYYGLDVDYGGFAVPVKRPKPIDELKVWRDKAVLVVKIERQYGDCDVTITFKEKAENVKEKVL
jgi:hypothetical protein